MSRKTMGQITLRYANHCKSITVLILDPTPLSLETFHNPKNPRPPQTNPRRMGERGYTPFGDRQAIDRLVCRLSSR